jgi:S-adenosylmethionine-diacylgycerolhomoserine-N-methlytransferase
MSDTTMENYYRFQADIYDLSRPFFLFDRDKTSKELVLKSGQVALEVGCGTGCNLHHLVEKAGPKGKVYGLDCSESMLRKAREKIEKNGWTNICLIKEYAENYTLEEKADLILFSYSLTMIPDWKAALNNARENLKDNGKLIILDFYVWHRNRKMFNIWKKWLKINHVNISDEPVEYLREISRDFKLFIFRGGYNYRLEAAF